MTTLKPYPSYVDSGAQWLGEVPADWAIVRAKTALRERKVKSEPADEHLTPSQTHGVLPQSEYMLRTGNKVVLNLTGADAMRHVEPNDFISHLRSFQGGFEHSRLAGKVSAAYTVLEPREGIVPDFLRYLFKSSRYIQALQTTTDQLRDGQSIRFAQVALLPLPLPDAETQKSVAEFLDRETAEIDAFIADQEELIGLLAERRSATISHAVTKGLDPSAPMMDSGVEWFEEVPASWTVGSLKHFARRITDGAHISPETDGGQHPFVSTRDIRDGRINLDSSLRTSSDTFDYMVRSGCQPLRGDVLFSKDGTVGRTAIVAIDEPFVVASSLIIISPRNAVESRYLNFLLMGTPVQEQISSFVKGAGLPRLSIANLEKVIGLMPSHSEQSAIADYLDHETGEFDSAIADAHESVALSRERRSALISAAVTGKIDVRDAE